MSLLLLKFDLNYLNFIRKFKFMTIKSFIILKNYIFFDKISMYSDFNGEFLW